MTHDPIPGLVRQLAIPASMGMFFNTMYNVVDTWYAGRFDTEALAALSLTFPVFFILLATGIGLSSGATALIGNALGKGDRAEAALVSTQGLVLSLYAAVGVIVIGFLAAPSLYIILGATDQYLSLCLDYIRIILPGSIFVFAFYMFNAALNSQGDTKAFRNYMLGATIANIVLDPIFMYGWLGLPAMGVKGIALATVLAQAGGAVFLGRRAWRTGLFHRSEGARWRPDGRVFRAIAGQGIPAGMNMMTVAVGVFVITYFLAKFGQDVVAAYGAATRIEQIVLLPALGLNTAALALTAQNSGAGKFDRVRELARVSLRYGAYLMLAGTALLFFGAELLMKAFTNSEHVVAIGAHYLRIAAFLEFSYVVLFLNTAILQGVKKPAFGLWIGLYRQLLMPVILFMVATRVFNFGLDGIWWSIFVINWSAAAIAAVYARRVVGELESEAG